MKKLILITLLLVTLPTVSKSGGEDVTLKHDTFEGEVKIIMHLVGRLKKECSFEISSSCKEADLVISYLRKKAITLDRKEELSKAYSVNAFRAGLMEIKN